MVELARVMVYGDIHLSSRNHGVHSNYPKESLEYFQAITNKAKELKVTHLIGLGDLTFGRFNTLEYRQAVEKELTEQFEITSGNRFELKGNHDVATYGMTEYEYYINKGLIRPACNLTIGNVNISMVNNGDMAVTKIIPPVDGMHNFVLMHDYLKFKDSNLPNFGKGIDLDDFEPWFGVDYIIGGHIHKYLLFQGLIVKEGMGARAVINYLGSMSRPSFHEGEMDEVGHLALITIYDNGQMGYSDVQIPLWSIEQSFNIDKKAAQVEKEEEKRKRIDLTDIVDRLNKHERSIGNPEDMIRALEGVDEKYKKKAIEYLKAN